MDASPDTPQRSTATAEDLSQGSALLQTLEWLGEVLDGCLDLPAALKNRASALAQGTSRVPADGERIDFVARVREAQSPAPAALALRGWLGEGLARWLDARVSAPTTALGLALRFPVERCLDAREALLARHRPAAQAFEQWYAAGLDAADGAVFAAASDVALGEAVDRWCALGCESDLRRYVTTWQRSASGWAEASLGRGFELPTEDLGRLRALQVHLHELHARRAPPRSLARALAARMGVSVAEAQRLMLVHGAVVEAGVGGAAIRRRMAVIRPIAEAAAALERELRRSPAVEEIAARARVHPCLVELALDAVGST